ncbi:MAG: endonuclease MutS2 [Oscillospiraceae bacterium]|nr:endonuclease MutS2 [Oscillospiraceae bacterium]
MINQKYARCLELDKILSMLAEYTCCDTAKNLALSIEPKTDLEDVQREIDRTNDIFQLTVRFGTPTYMTLKNPVGRLKIAQSGGVLSCGDLLSIAAVLRQARILSQWQNQWENEENAVSEEFSMLYLNNPLERDISAAIISEDTLDDNASSELAAIRRKIRSTELKIRDRMDKMVRSATYQKYLQDAIITMRDGRFVVPVKAEYRNEVPGMVHDTSGSGSTYFVEPAAIVDANNEIRVLQAKEQEEIERILAEFSARVGEEADGIIRCFNTVIDLNILFAKSTLAYKMKAMAPKITDDGHILLKKARHPLIDPKKAVPIDFELGRDYTTLVITGPNTGGKTVTLKTAGLLTLMTMCGLLIPVADGSSISVFEDILVDIGDEQSIEQSLSTFSAHMVNLVSILEVASYTSLVIIDELGSGTDPIEGAALAVAILEKLRKRGAKVAVTSHYAELKMYALQTDKVENACCEFNIETLAPTYRLMIGVPGKSNAFAISKKLGLDDEIIDEAASLVESDNKRFEEVVDSLEASRQKYEQMMQEMADEKAAIDREKAEIDAYREKLAHEEEKEEEKAKIRAQAIVRDVQAQADAVLAELAGIKKLKESDEFGKLILSARSSVRGKMSRMHDAANPIHERTNEGYTLPRPLKPGDAVQIYDIDKAGTVLKAVDKNGMVLVQTGILKSRVPIGNLRLLDQSKIQVNGQPTGKKSLYTPARGGGSIRTASVSRGSRTGNTGSRGLAEVDLRGMNVEEALIEVDRFIDSSVLSGIHQVTIIHGKGTGVLRDAIQNHLKHHTSVKSFRLGAYGEGETGVTIAELK